MTARKRQSEDKYIIRFPEGMRKRVKEFAKREGRSMNSQIVRFVENGLTTSGNHK